MNPFARQPAFSAGSLSAGSPLNPSPHNPFAREIFDEGEEAVAKRIEELIAAQSRAWIEAFFAPPPGARTRTTLVKDPQRICNALAFAMWRHGLVMNTHLTVSGAALGIHDQRDFLGLLAPYNKEAARWLKVGEDDPGRIRQRLSERAALGGSPHHYVWVAENSPTMGFHIHQLCFLPPGKVAGFREMTRRWFAAQAGRDRLPTEAVHVRHYKPRNEADGVQRMWSWFRYLVKNTGKDVWCRDDYGRRVHVREFLRPWLMQEQAPIYAAQLCGMSHSLSVGSQRAAGFVSRLVQGEWDTLYDGAELDQYRDRLETKRLEAAVQRFALD